jgi:DNA primase
LADEIGEIRLRIDILDLVSQRVALKKAGKHWKGLCPFHEDRNPSFYVSTDTGRYKCWACGEGGDIFNWVMKTQNVDFTEALHILAKQAGVTLSKKGVVEHSERVRRLNAMESALTFFRAEFERSSRAKEYCEGRGIDAETVQLWEMGYAPEVDSALTSYLQKGEHSLAECKQLFLVDQDPAGGFFDKFRGRLIFPIRDERGELVAFGGRLLGDGHPKYINSGDTPIYRKSRVLYGMHIAKEAISKTRVAILVEGYLDVIACHRAGVDTAVASLGTALAEDHVKLLKRWCDEVVVLYDSDEAGQKAASRASELLVAAGLKVRVALMPPGDDPDTLLRTQGEDAVKKAALGGISPLDYAMRSLKLRHDPSQDEFWTEAMATMASYPAHLEVERHIEELAGFYPGIRDKVAAQRILRNQIASIRRQKSPPSSKKEKPIIHHEITASMPISVPERALMIALMRDIQRQKSWEALGDQDLFETEAGSRMALAIRGAFPTKPPVGKPAEWLSQIEPAVIRDELANIEMEWRIRLADDRIDPDRELEGAIALLKKKREERKLQELKKGTDDATLREINKRLKALRPDNR